MGISRNQYIFVLLTGLLKCLEQAFHLAYGLLNPGTGEKFQIHEHLVVAGTTGVDFLSDVTKLTCQHQFHLRVDILNVWLNLKLAFGSRCI